MTLPVRVLHLPMAFNERWTHGAIQKYMRSVRSEGPYLPSNVDFVAANNGLTGGIVSLLTGFTLAKVSYFSAARVILNFVAASGLTGAVSCNMSMTLSFVPGVYTFPLQSTFSLQSKVD